MEVLKQFALDAAKLAGTVIFAEGDEERTIEAAVRLKKDGICNVIVVAPTREAITSLAAKKNLDISGLTLMTPSLDVLDKEVFKGFLEGRLKKGLTEEQARAVAMDPLLFSDLYVKSGKATGCVAGARSSTPDVIRAAIYGIGTAAGTKLLSSFFLMVPPEGHPVIKKPIIYADCGVNPDPSELGMRDIAVASVKSLKCLFPEESPRIAFLSFSTKGSAEHKMLEKIRKAVELTKRDLPGVAVDGELQFDAAVIPSVAQRKSPGSPVAGNANIFIFPDLNAGNISYKITERLGGFTALGPLLQGLSKPVNDLSRGCSVEDIYYVAIITLLQSR